MKRPIPSVFSATALTLTGAMIFFLLFTLTISAWLVIIPMAKRSADDLAGLIVFSAQTWVELPAYARPALIRELKREHGLDLEEVKTIDREHATIVPYVRFLHDAVVRRFDQCSPSSIDPDTHDCIYIGTLTDNKGFWLELPIAGHVLKFEFSRNRVGTQIPFMLILILAAGVTITLATALWVTRRLTRPVSALTEQVQQGLPDSALPLTGPQETRVLIEAINQRSAEVKRLLENRTAMLAGISHDLRTPLTRLTLGIELAGEGIEPELREQLKQDIATMNRLISEVLLIARGVTRSEGKPVELNAWLANLVTDAKRAGIDITLVGSDQPLTRSIPELVLRRVLENLIDNAHQYAPGPQILRLTQQADATIICLEDQGPGLDEAEIERLLEPFARKDPARTSGPEQGGHFGLGLSIAQAMSQAQGWHLSLAPRAADPKRGHPGGLNACISLPDEQQT